MAATFLRRSAATAGLAVAATVASPLVGIAFAATFSGAITSNPADSSGTVAANRPTFIATYTDNLRSGSTITVKQGSTTIACPQVINAKTVSCTPSADLVDGKAYDVSSHGVSAVDGSTADAPQRSFTASIPTVTSSTPLFDGSLIKADSNNPLSITFNQEIFANTSHSTFVVHDLDGDAPSGSTSFSASGAPLDSTVDTIVFKPSGLPAGAYTATVHVDGVGANSADNPAAHFDKTFNFWVSGQAPAGITHDAFINNTNMSAVPFSGTAAPGLQVNVDIINAVDPTGKTDGTGSTVVPSCATAPNCPWSLTVDASTLGNGIQSPDGTYDWTATTADGNTDATNNSNSGSPAATGTIVEDTTAPDEPNPTVAPNPVTTTLLVSATDGSTDVVSYLVDITDSTNTTLHSEYAAQSHNLHQQSIDVSSLADGTLKVLVTAVDAAGNQAFPTTNDGTGPQPAPTKVTKNQGVQEDFAHSSLTVDDQTVPLATASTQPVRKPSAVTVEFTQPIRLDWVDSSGTHGLTPVHHSASACVKRVTPNAGGCISSGGLTLTPDKKGFTIGIPAGAIGNDGGFSISYSNIWPAAFCPDLPQGPAKTQNSLCIAKSGTVQDPRTGTNFVFNVDGTPPNATLITISMPSRIGPDSVHFVGISGTAEPNNTVSLTLKSSGGGSTFFAGHGNAITADSNGHWQTVEDLSSLRDGTLTVTAKVFDVAGNETDKTLTPAPVLAAHTSTLTEKVSTSRITFGQITQVTGRLVDQSGVGIKGATIQVRPRFSSGSYGSSIKAVTDSTGHWGVIAAPAHNATWYASYAGSTSPVHDAAATHTARTLVRVAIRFTSPKNHAKVGSPVVLKGAVAPNKRGATVAIYRHTSSGNKLLGKVKLDRYSRWSFKLSLPHGTFKFFAVIGNTTGNLGNRTSYLTLTH